MSTDIAPKGPEMTATKVRELRDAFGKFATGVTIVTTAGPDGEPIGVTANSFGSISLEPPLVIWALANDALSRYAFETADTFCIHVLTSAQRSLSERFARRGMDKFRHVGWEPNADSIPLLSEFAARFLCRNTRYLEVGDHTLFIGEVLEFDRTDDRPLVFHSGMYVTADRRNAGSGQSRPTVDRDATIDRRKK